MTALLQNTVSFSSTLLAETPFGQVSYQSGTASDYNNFLFSSKYWDRESGLGYWGYRWYETKMGRWLSRDPRSEQGGLNLQSFCVNDGLNGVDLLGKNLIKNGIWEVEKCETISGIYQKLKRQHKYTLSYNDFLARLKANSPNVDINKIYPKQLLDFRKYVYVMAISGDEKAKKDFLLKMMLTETKPEQLKGILDNPQGSVTVIDMSRVPASSQEEFEQWFTGQVTGTVLFKLAETSELVVGGWIIGNVAGVVFEVVIAVPALIPAVDEAVPPFGYVNSYITIETWNKIKEVWER